MKIKKVFASDNAFKIYSVLIAVLLWTFVAYNQNPESSKTINNIPVYYTNTDILEREGFVVLNENDPTVNIRIYGRRLSIGKVDRRNVTASATIPEIRAGTFDVAIDVRLPISDVSITDKNPYVVRTVVEKMRTVEMPVNIVYTGNPKTPFTSVQSKASPEKVTLWGPESVINKIAALEVSIDIGSISEDTQATYEYRIIDHSGDDITDNVNIRRNIDSVSVTSSVYRTKDVTVVPEYSGQLPEGYIITGYSVSPETVRLGSKDSSVDNLSEIRTQPINIGKFTNSTKVTAGLAVPEGFTVLSDTENVEVTIIIEKLESKTFSISDIAFENAKNGLKYEVVGLPVEVSVSGAKSVIDRAELSASVNVDGVGVGTHELSLNINAPQLVNVPQQYRVTVQVSE